MVCRPFGARLSSEPMLTYCQLDRKLHISVEFYLKFKYFIQGYALENVCEMEVILPRPQCVKPVCISYDIYYMDIYRSENNTEPGDPCVYSKWLRMD